MNKNNKTIDQEFLEKLTNEMVGEPEINIKRIYALFPEANQKTILWRLHKLVQQGKLFKASRGYYSAVWQRDHLSAGYEYLQKKSQKIYDAVSEYGYEFYLTGLDSLVGEVLHVPEQYTVLIVVEEVGIDKIREALSDQGYFAVGEKDHKELGKIAMIKKIDVIILKGKNFDLASNRIAKKEKGFVDLYFAVTRLDYEVSIQELSRIYENMQRNKTITKYKMKESAKDRGISTEINWLVALDNTKPKALEFMGLQMRDSQ